MNFKEWLVNEDYEQWKRHVSSIARTESPFQDWFPQSRVYVPFQQQEATKGDQEIEEILKELGYEVLNWKKGLAIKPNQPKQPMKIGRILNKEYANKINKLEIKLQQGEISQLLYNRELKSFKDYFDEIIIQFQTSPTRSQKNEESNYYIVFTIDPHDIAKMSTDRSWTSCMELGRGQHYKDVFCEVARGGFLAYLINKNDQEIQKPLARIHIRRFDNKKGQSVAMPEESVYGAETDSFYQAVQQWLDQKQGAVRPGQYKRRGGSYSDTFGDRKTMIAPTTGKELAKWLRAYQTKDAEKKKRLTPYTKAAIEQVAHSDKKYNKKLVRLAIDTAKMHPYWKDYITSIVGKYPGVASDEEIAGLALYRQEAIAKKNPKFKEFLADQAKAKIMGELDIDNPSLQPDKDLSANKEAYDFTYSHVGKVNDMLDYISPLKELTEPIIRKVVKFGNDLLDRYSHDIETAKGLKSPIPNRPASAPLWTTLSSIIHNFAMKNADTPTVVNFYKRLLPYYEKTPKKEYELWRALLTLGRNGEPFIPYLKRRLKEEQNEGDSWYKEQRIEQLNYTIDSIESGKGRSSKYSFH